MGALKNAMFDIGYKAMDVGIEETSNIYHMDEDDIKACILFASGFDGDWEEFVAQGHWDESKIVQSDKPRTYH